MDIENNDIELFREMLQNLFFNGDEFVALNLGLYPYQTCIDNKSVDRLAGFFLDIFGIDEKRL